MARFCTVLLTRPAPVLRRRPWWRLWPGRPEWVLHTPLVYESDVAGLTITVPAGFQTDGASTPRLPMVYLIWDTGLTAASTVHDYLYRTDPPLLDDRGLCDQVYDEALGAPGPDGAPVHDLPEWQRAGHYWGVRVGGWLTWDRRRAALPFYQSDRDLAP